MRDVWEGFMRKTPRVGVSARHVQEAAGLNLQHLLNVIQRVATGGLILTLL